MILVSEKEEEKTQLCSWENWTTRGSSAEMERMMKDRVYQMRGWRLGLKERNVAIGVLSLHFIRPTHNNIIVDSYYATR